MKFGKKVELNKKLIRTIYAWYPITINKETIWLEKVKIYGYYYENIFDDVRWKSISFVK